MNYKQVNVETPTDYIMHLRVHLPNHLPIIDWMVPILRPRYNEGLKQWMFTPKPMHNQGLDWGTGLVEY